MPFPAKTIRRFEAKFRKGAPDECWEWVGRLNDNGYGTLMLRNKRLLAHRISYQIYRGEIDGPHVLHKCDNPPCVNPNHLFTGTQADNNRDMTIKGRHGMCRLTKDDVLAIRRKYKKTAYHHHNAEQLAVEFGVVKSHIMKIVKRELWKYV